jgi:hypothetical protein
MDDLLDLGQGGLFIDGLDPVDLGNLDTIIAQAEQDGVVELEIDTTNECSRREQWATSGLEIKTYEY